MTLVIIRNIILFVGWPILLLGSIFLIRQSIYFYRKIGKNVFGKIVMILTTSNIITMFCLGFVATIFMIRDIDSVASTVLPIFGVWFVVFFVLMFIEYGLDREAIAYNNKMNELSMAKDEFLATASHQLRTPLTSIKWALDLAISEGQISENNQNLFYSIYNENDRLIDLVSKLLSSARIETGKIIVFNEEIDLKIFIEEIIKTFYVRAENNGQKIQFTTDLLETKIYTDKILLGESLKNLINNSIIHGTKNSPIIVKIEKDKDFYIVSIHNKGGEISDMQKAHMFKKFTHSRQVNGALETEIGGLGLFIVKSFIETIGGKIDYSSNKEDGTIFFITVPIRHTTLTSLS